MSGIVKKILESESFPERGYEVHSEIWSLSIAGGPSDPTPMDAAYALHDGSYIGDPGLALRFWQKYGITHWECPYPDPKRRPDENSCAMGFSPKSKKWYGWSHRAIFGFGVGHVVQPGDIGTEYLGPGSGDVKVGTKLQNLDQAKDMAVKFAQCVAKLDEGEELVAVEMSAANVALIRAGSAIKAALQVLDS